MPSVSDPSVLASLIQRLESLEPDTSRNWGTLTAGEMLCHLGDATASVLARGKKEQSRRSAEPIPSKLFLKWIGLRCPLPWPKGLKTPASVDPHAGGTKPSDFENDRQRAINGLRAVAGSAADNLAASHGAFGPMSIADWHRWANRHTDHHLRQFGK